MGGSRARPSSRSRSQLQASSRRPASHRTVPLHVVPAHCHPDDGCPPLAEPMTLMSHRVFREQCLYSRALCLFTLVPCPCPWRTLAADAPAWRSPWRVRSIGLCFAFPLPGCVQGRGPASGFAKLHIPARRHTPGRPGTVAILAQVLAEAQFKPWPGGTLCFSVLGALVVPLLWGWFGSPGVFAWGLLPPRHGHRTCFRAVGCLRLVHATCPAVCPSTSAFARRGRTARAQLGVPRRRPLRRCGDEPEEEDWHAR